MPNCQNNMYGRTTGSMLPRQTASSRNTGCCGRNTGRLQADVTPTVSRNCSREDCGRNDDFLKGTTIAMAYVPWQQWQNVYEICRGFERGTIFEDLNKPFTGKGGRR